MTADSELRSWGPDPRNLPKDTPPDLLNAYRAIARATKQLERACRVLRILQSHNGEFVDIVNREELEHALSTMQNSMTRDLMVTTYALYDKNGTHVRRAASSILNEEYRTFLEKHTTSRGADFKFYITSRRRLESAVRLAQSSVGAKNFRDIEHYRNKLVAHFDIDPKEKIGRYRSIEILITIAALIIIPTPTDQYR